MPKLNRNAIEPPLFDCMNTTFDPRNFTPGADELAGRVIAITGPTQGIGRALALACAKHGATVVLVGRNVKKLEAVHAEIAALGREEATIAPFDLEKAVANDYDTLAGATLERYGRLDGLVHNASILGQMAPIEHYDVPTWLRVMHVNVTAAFALTQVLASELDNTTAIRVNAVNPGATRTMMRLQAYPAENPETLPLPEAVVGPYIALLGPASRGITGQSFDAQFRR
jgi:NAD(P)-dependent dehydrogenase (short-subunit alcohol dehydrogenase family)